MPGCVLYLPATDGLVRSAPPMKRRILLVDDDVAVLLTLKAVLELNHFTVETAASAAEAIEKLAAGVYQMVITDARMENANAGFEVSSRGAPSKPTTLLPHCSRPTLRKTAIGSVMERSRC
jgi:CheY-like chemotaxis protein